LENENQGMETMQPKTIEREAFSVVGIRRTTPNAGGTWGVVKSDAELSKQIVDVSGRFFDLGLCFGFKDGGANDYMCAVEWTGDTPEGFDRWDYPAMTWLKFDAVGKISDGPLFKVWQHINGTYLPQNGHKKVNATIEKYLEWDEANGRCNVEIWIPVALNPPANEFPRAAPAGGNQE
jgi:AraC family transcriptional regulator